MLKNFGDWRLLIVETFPPENDDNPTWHKGERLKEGDHTHGFKGRVLNHVPDCIVSRSCCQRHTSSPSSHSTSTRPSALSIPCIGKPKPSIIFLTYHETRSETTWREGGSLGDPKLVWCGNHIVLKETRFGRVKSTKGIMGRA
jgi:hypothetical protein